MNTKLILSFAAACGISYALGYISNPPNSISNDQPETTAPKSKSDLLNNSKTNNQDSNTGETKIPKINEIPVENETASIEAVYEHLNPKNEKQFAIDSMQSLAKLYFYLSNLSTIELIGIAESYSSNKLDPSLFSVLSTALEILTDRDPKLAMEIAQSYPKNKEHFYRSAQIDVLERWSKKSPLEAYQWYADTISPSKITQEEESLLGRAIAHVTAHDFDLGMEKLKEQMASRKLTPAATGSIAYKLDSSEEFETYIDIVKDLDSSYVTSNVLGQWVTRKPKDAFKWLDTMEEGPDRKRLTQDTFSSWVWNDPVSATEWKLSRTEPDSQPEELTKIAKKWARSDAEAALNYFVSLEDIDASQAIRTTIFQLGKWKPARAMDNIDFLVNEQDKLALSQIVLKVYMDKSRKQAQEFIENSPYKNELIEYQNKQN